MTRLSSQGIISFASDGQGDFHWGRMSLVPSHYKAYARAGRRGRELFVQEKCDCLCCHSHFQRMRTQNLRSLLFGAGKNPGDGLREADLG